MKFNNAKYFLKILLLVMVSLGVGCSFGQNTKNTKTNKKPFKDRIFVGGSLGFSLGNYSSMVEVIPIIGFEVSEKFIVGLGLTYKYYRYKDYYAKVDSSNNIIGFYDFKTNIYGGSIWARYFLKGIGIPVIENVFLHGEFEPLVFVNNYVVDPYGEYWDGYYYYSEGSQRNTLSGIFLGGGLQQPLGGRSYMYLEVLWNFNEELYSPYSNPRIRIGVAAGL